MKKCLVCQEKFPVHIIIEGQLRNLNSRKYCLSCSPFGKHNTSPILSKKEAVYHKCLFCAKLLPFGRRAYCSDNCKQKMATKRSRLARKKKAIEYKGGGCQVCGYNRALGVLQFHHFGEKKYSISRIMYWKWERLKKELDQCVLLCANHHAEEHDEMFSKRLKSNSLLLHLEKQSKAAINKRRCPYCNKKLLGIIKSRKYCDAICKNRMGIVRFRRNRKKVAVRLKGGKCILCGYSKSDWALHFHHLENKIFEIGHGYRWDNEHFLDELKKCVLLCGNCHGEVHEGFVTKDQVCKAAKTIVQL
jgi:predicted nucleic acid-binding Zn ribbon protein